MMLMRWWGLLGLAFLVLPSSAVAEENTKIIAVIEFRNARGMDQAALLMLADFIREGVIDATKSEGKRFSVMTRERITSYAEAQGIDLSCLENECEVKTGQDLGAHYVVSGTIAKMGREWVVAIRIHDTLSEEVLGAKSVQGKDPSDLIKPLKLMAAKLTAEALKLKPPKRSTGSGSIFGESGTTTPPGRMGEDTSMAELQAKLRQKRCRGVAKSKGDTLQAQRINTAVQQKQAQVIAAFDLLIPKLKVCVQLDYNDRDKCRGWVTDWIEMARNAKAHIPPKSVLIQTDCGQVEEVSESSQRAVNIDTRAAKDWLRLLNKKDATMISAEQFTEARNYEYGLGRSQNLSRAASGYRQACETGHGRACAAYAHMHLSGRGGTQSSQSTANLWYSKGCGNGDGESCRLQGERTSKGSRSSTWYDRALTLNRASCRHKDGESCHSLGKMYSLGQGESQSHKQAFEAYRIACGYSSGAGCRSLGYAYVHGRGVRMDRNRGLEYYQRACNLGDGAGCRNLGIQLQKSGHSVAGQYRAACAKGDGRGCAIVGYRFERRRNYLKAGIWYQKACNLGSGIGCNNLAAAMTAQRGFSRSQSRNAYAYYKKACGLGYRKGCK